MSLGPPARLLPPWIHTSTGSLPLIDGVRTSSVRQSSLPISIVGIVPALVVLDAGGGLRGRVANALPGDHRLRRLPAELADGRRGERDAAEQEAAVPVRPADRAAVDRNHLRKRDAAGPSKARAGHHAREAV